MGRRHLAIQIDRELVMRCAERATAAGVSTATWIGDTLAQGIEAGTATTEGRGPKDESPVA